MVKDHDSSLLPLCNMIFPDLCIYYALDSYANELMIISYSGTHVFIATDCTVTISRLEFLRWYHQEVEAGVSTLLAESHHNP